MKCFHKCRKLVATLGLAVAIVLAHVHVPSYSQDRSPTTSGVRGAAQDRSTAGTVAQNAGQTPTEVAAVGQRDTNGTRGTIAFDNVRLFDGVKVIPATSVIVREGRVAAVGGEIDLTEADEVIDGTGRTLMPGLIDCHTHTFDEHQLEQAAVFGVTTELDMAGDPRFAIHLRTQSADGNAPVRADLFAAGTPVTAPGGHPTQLPWFRTIPTIENPEQAQAFIDARLAEGSDYIKIIYDDGSVYGLPFRSISRSTLDAVIRAVHTRNKLAVAHISAREAARAAITGGVDGLAHCFVDDPVDDALIQLAVDKQTFIVPTLTILESSAGVAGGAQLAQDESFADLLTSEDVRSLQATFPRQVQARVDYAVAKNAIAKLARAGVPILAGTDVPNPGTAHGVSMHRELRLLVEAGLSPSDALAAATSQAAKAFALADRGRIAPGARADLVLVAGDPTRDITSTRRIVGVWKDGHRVNRRRYRNKVASERKAIAQTRADKESSASQSVVVSDFEGEQVSVNFGAGWVPSTDNYVGGKSTSTFKRVPGGANGSRGSLLIEGNIEDRPQPRWAGVMFAPGPIVMVPADLSAHKAVSFWVKGDGKTCTIMLFFLKRGFQPSAKAFVAGNEWKQHRFQLTDFDGCDGSDIMAVFFGGGETTGPFRFQIDEFRFE